MEKRPTKTEYIISDLDLAYSKGLESQAGHRDHQAAAHAGMTILESADRISRAEMTVEQAIEAATLYGKTEKIAMELNDSTQVLISRTRFAQVLARAVLPNRDEGKIESSLRLRSIGEEYLKSGDRKSAAIELTNSALQILELHNPTKDQLINAQDSLRRTRGMRTSGSLDFAYSEINLALADRLLAQYAPQKNGRDLFMPIIKSLDRAARIFKKNNAKGYRSIYYKNVVQVFSAWLNLEIELSHSALQATNMPADFIAPNEFFVERGQSARLVSSNPAAFGFQTAPAWIPTQAEALAHALEKIPELEVRISAVDKFLENSSNSNAGVRAKLFELRSILTPLLGLPEPPFDAFDNFWDCGDLERYFLHARDFLTWEQAPNYASDRYVTLLVRVLTCVRSFRSSWSEYDIERFLRRNPVALRFAACELGRLESWKEAFELLELSRGLESSRTTTEPGPDDSEASQDGISWIHLTHSPRATYAILCVDGSYFGNEFTHANGKVLAAEFSGFSPKGLLMGQSVGDRSASREAASRIEYILRPIMNWITKQVGRISITMSGGYFQAFPVWAVGDFGNAILDSTKLMTHAPSRAIARINRENLNENLAKVLVSVQDASAVPGNTPLELSSIEADFISAVTPDWITAQFDATSETIKDALESSSLLHFTGHSVSEIDPMESRLLTYGTPLTVREILSANVTADVVVLGSCQSALAQNMHLQDEVLSIQTAIYYAGAHYAIGTFWPITDLVGFIFTLRFYGSLADSAVRCRADINDERVLGAWSKSVSWMRSATVEDVNTVLAGHTTRRMKVSAPKENAFQLYDWAAFCVVGGGLPRRLAEIEAARLAVS